MCKKTYELKFLNIFKKNRHSCGGKWIYSPEKTSEHKVEILDSYYARYYDVWICDKCGKEYITSTVALI